MGHILIVGEEVVEGRPSLLRNVDNNQDNAVYRVSNSYELLTKLDICSFLDWA